MSRKLGVLALVLGGCGGEIGDPAPNNVSEVESVVIRLASSSTSVNLLEMAPGESVALKAVAILGSNQGESTVTTDAEWLISDPKLLTGVMDEVAQTWEITVQSDPNLYVDAEELGEVTVSAAWGHVTSDPPLLVRISP